MLQLTRNAAASPAASNVPDQHIPCCTSLSSWRRIDADNWSIPGEAFLAYLAFVALHWHLAIFVCKVNSQLCVLTGNYQWGVAESSCGIFQLCHWRLHAVGSFHAGNSQIHIQVIFQNWQQHGCALIVTSCLKMFAETLITLRYA